MGKTVELTSYISIEVNPILAGDALLLDLKVDRRHLEPRESANKLDRANVLVNVW